MTEPVAFVAPPAVLPAQEPSAAPVTPTSPGIDSEAPPWGDDFDPARAWHTIQQLREQEKYKGPRLTPEQEQQLSEYQRLVEASKSETQRQAEAVAQATRDADTARAEAVRYRVAATNGITAEDFDLLGSGTEEEITARAQRISALRAAAATPPATPPVGAPPTRPLEQLRPGATPAGVQSEDDVIYQSLFGQPQQS